MENLIVQLKEKYQASISKIEKVGAAEINIVLNNAVDGEKFARNLKNHLLEVIDDQTIMKFDISNTNGELIDSFATNQ